MTKAPPENLQNVFDRAFAGNGQARESFVPPFVPREVGTIASISTGIARVSGLPGVGFDELLEFPGGVSGIAFNVDEDEIGVVLLGAYWHLAAGDDVERPAPPSMDRALVTEPLQTGLKVVVRRMKQEGEDMKKLLTILAGILVVSCAVAGNKPIQISITPDVALFDRSEMIEGLCLSLWGENPQSAVALGVVNGSRGRSAGLSWALALNYADGYTGIQLAPINYTKADCLGWQGGFVNYAAGQMKGLQTGTVNYAGRLTGLQLGLVNYAESAATGVQIGLINFIPSNQWFTALPDELAPGMMLVNWRF